MFTSRSFLSALLLIAGASVTSAFPSRTTSDGLIARSGLSINPPIVLANVVESHASDTRVEARHLTNAERLARGLPLNRPRIRATPVAPGASTPSPTVYTGSIKVTRVSGLNYGYLSPGLNSEGGYGTMQASSEGALKVTFTYYPDGRVFDLRAVNPLSSNYAYLGGVFAAGTANSNIGPGSISYATVTGTSQTSGGPAKLGDTSLAAANGISTNYESTIWSFDPSTKALTAQWTNGDGSKPITHILYSNDWRKAIILVGDTQILEDILDLDFPEVILTFVPE